MSARPPRFPFLYYGHEPRDWRDQQHCWEIRFLAAPDGQTRRAIARLVARRSRGARFSPGRWGWCGVWALALVDEAPGAERDYRRFFAELAALFEAVHAIAPIAELVHGNSTAKGGGAWDAWSHAQQPWPSPHPAWRLGGGMYARNYGIADGYVDGAAGVPVAPDPETADFDRVLAAELEAISAKERQRAAEATQERAARDKPTLVRFGGLLTPPAAPAAVVTSWAREHHLSAVTVSGDGRRALGVVGRHVHEFDVLEGRAACVWSVTEEAFGAALAEKGALLALGRGDGGSGVALALLRRDAGAWPGAPLRLLNTLAVPDAVSLHPYGDGRQFAVRTVRGAALVVGVRGEELRIIARFSKAPSGTVVLRDEVVFGAGDDTLHAVNLETPWARWTLKDEAAKWLARQARAQRRGAACFVETERAFGPSIPPAAAGVFAAGARLWSGPSGRIVACERTGEDVRLAFLEDGARRTFGLGAPLGVDEAVAVAIDVDGARALVGAGDRVWEVTLPEARVRPVARLAASGFAAPRIRGVCFLGRNDVAVGEGSFAFRVLRIGAEDALYRGSVPCGLLPSTLAGSPDGRYLFVSHREDRGSPVGWVAVFERSGETFEQTGRVSLLGPAPELRWELGGLVARTAYGSFELHNVERVTW